MSKPLQLRLATFNIHGCRPRTGPPDAGAIALILRRIDADIAGLQEVHRFLPPPGIFMNQPAELRRRLQCSVVFRRSFGAGPAGYGNVLVSRTPPKSSRRILLPSVPERRSLLVANYQEGGNEFCVINTHLGLMPQEQEAQLQVLARFVETTSLPVILIGDLNVTPDTPATLPLLRAGLQDCAQEQGGVELPTFPAWQPAARLDYVMVSSHFSVQNCYTLDTRVSDHLPLIAEVVMVTSV